MSAAATETHNTRQQTKYDKLIVATKSTPPVPTIVVHPCDETSLRGAVELRGAVDSAGAGIIEPILVGQTATIRGTASKYDLNVTGFDIIDAAHSEEAAAKAVELIDAAKRVRC